MKFRKIAALFIAAVLAAAALTACGGSASEATDTADTVDTADTADAAAAPSEDASVLTGTWEVTAFMDTNSGESYDIDEYAEKNGVTADDIRVDYIFSDDGACSCVLAGAEATGKFTFDGLNVVCSFDNGTEVSFEYDEEGPVLVSLDPATGISTMLYKIS